MNASTSCAVKLNCLRWLSLVVFLSFRAFVFAQVDEISQYQHIRFEYHNRSDTGKNPLIICIPGFTQHNRSPEFLLLKKFFRDNGFSFLIMNPPQHGEDFVWFDKLYSWGDDEAKDLLALITYLNILKVHDEVHLLGFSIGAKIVLKFATFLEIKESLKSIVAVAAPYRVGDINMRLSGDIGKIFEGVVSSFYAIDRASLFRILYMVFAGMSKAFVVSNDSPAGEIPSVKEPTLLLHGANDWLTKSYHSVKLYGCAENDQRFSLVALNTRTHAEDMLSRDGSKVRNAFLEILNEWFDFVKNNVSKDKNSFNRYFLDKLNLNAQVKKVLFPSEKISLLTSPILHESNTNIWTTPAEQNFSLITVNGKLQLKDSNISKYFVAFGSTNPKKSMINKFNFGMSFEPNGFGNASTHEGYLAFYHIAGSILWMRKLTYIFGFGNSFNRRIISADLALLILDFQLNYGTFFDRGNDCQISFNFPLISNASNSYFLGVGYNRFLSSASDFFSKNNFKVYFNLGLPPNVLKTNIRLHLQYEHSGIISPEARSERIYTAGLSLNLGIK
jgi:pimeloyl-ACP methyl ester carboxylesterase